MSLWVVPRLMRILALGYFAYAEVNRSRAPA